MSGVNGDGGGHCGSASEVADSSRGNVNSSVGISMKPTVDDMLTLCGEHKLAIDSMIDERTNAR